MNKSSNTLLFLFFISILTTHVFTLDFFFFSKFYNDGMCKDTEELKKYMLKSKRDEPEFNVLEPLLLTSMEDPIVNFGLYLTNNQKPQLSGAHAFFKTVYPAMSDTEKVYFPDMVSCVTKIPFFSLFGYRDTYGIIYNLVPTLEQNREEDLSGDDYTLNDLVDIYLDVFKAMQALVSNDYFLIDVTHDDIGITMDNEDINTHIRGKLRLLHNFRTTSANCYPKKMKSYTSILQSIQKFGGDPKKIDMSSSNPCQVLNLIDIWTLFIDSVTSYYNRQKGIFFNFTNCIQDMVERHNQPQLHGPQNYCPEEIQVAWKDISIRRGLRTMDNSGLLYTAESVVKFYIYVLGRMKNGFMEGTVLQELKSYQESIRKREKMLKDIQKDKNQLSDLEQIEQQILSKKVERKKRVSKEDSFDKIIKDREISPSLVEEMSEKTKQDKTQKKRKVDFDVFESDLSDKDTDLVIEEIENKKRVLIDDQNKKKETLQEELDTKRDQVIFNFKRLVMKALINERKEKAEKHAKKEEINEIEQKRTKNKIEKFKPNLSIEDQSVLEDEKEDAKFNQVIVIDSPPKNKTKKSEHSSDISGDDISEEDSNSSSNSNSQIDFMFDENNEIKSRMKDEQMKINSLQIAYDEQNDPNQEFIRTFEEDVIGKGHNIQNIDEKSEESVIMVDKAHANSNNKNILKHSLEGYILTGASLSMQKREANKLQQVGEIYQFRDQIQVLIDQGKQKDDPEIASLEDQIIEKTGTLIDQFGEAESLIELDQSLEHYTLGDLRDDLTKGEMHYISKLNQLVKSNNLN